MEIALIGYGKMGKEIEKILLARGHSIPVIIDRDNTEDLSSQAFKQCNAAIEFSNPESAYENIKSSILAGVPIVSGTTGWLDKKDDLNHFCQIHDGCYLYSSNYSIGVNIFFAINRQLAKMMGKYPEYELKLKEIHHTTKLDAPSGTGISLANDILKENPHYSKWVNHTPAEKWEIPLISERISDAPGTHTVNYSSTIDTIEISHEAKSRKGFAMGAVLAAEWLKGKKGIYTMKDVLGF